jgi:hypothetical protein
MKLAGKSGLLKSKYEISSAFQLCHNTGEINDPSFGDFLARILPTVRTMMFMFDNEHVS